MNSFRAYLLTGILALLICAPLRSIAQEAEESVTAATTYLDGRTQDLQQYLNRSGKIRERLLKRLRRQEEKMARRLAAKDSALYRQYMSQKLSYDSIAHLSHDTTALAKLSQKKNKVIDSLRGVQQFLQKQSGKLGAASSLAGKAGVDLPYTDKLNQLQQQLNGQQQLDELIRQRTSSLQQLAQGQNIGGLAQLQKNVYYAQEKMKSWKALADDPDEAEEKAMEYLQGTEGFSDYLNTGDKAFGGLGNNATAADLQRMGFQTKDQVNSMLQEKLGSSLGAVQQQMGQQLQDYTGKLDGIKGKLGEVKSSVDEARQGLQEARQAKDKLKHIEKPAFKKNPERGKPFWQRLETQYNFQTSRAGTDGLRPAMLELGVAVAFKHTPRLSYGLGLGLSTGLGQNWQNIHLSYEGISARAFAGWKWIYGFSFQAGYERSFRPGNRAYLPEQQTTPQAGNTNNDNVLKEAFGGQQQAAYIGVMKRYRINSRWSGTLLAGYNFLWQHEGLRSPWMLRFGWGK
ncbi:hypothetical protein [Taibaiella koreensis]|uniref:hypothetical protein n=1 Tax=Taibaiella koreensis TaxID=1268548 RepID=UPI0013C2B36E|nr:hypothetical protein [Taibaiella koreensis]